MAEAYISSAANIIGTSALGALQTNPAFIAVVASAIANGQTSPADLSSLVENSSIQSIVNSAVGSTILTPGVAANTASATGTMATNTATSGAAARTTLTGTRSGTTTGTMRTIATANTAAASSAAASARSSATTNLEAFTGRQGIAFMAASLLLASITLLVI